MLKKESILSIRETADIGPGGRLVRSVLTEYNLAENVVITVEIPKSQFSFSELGRRLGAQETEYNKHFG